MANVDSHPNFESHEFSIKCWNCSRIFKKSFLKRRDTSGLFAEMVVFCPNCGNSNIISIPEEYVELTSLEAYERPKDGNGSA